MRARRGLESNKTSPYPAGATITDDDNHSTERSYKKIILGNKKCPFRCYLCEILGSDYLHSCYESENILNENDRTIFNPMWEKCLE